MTDEQYGVLLETEIRLMDYYEEAMAEKKQWPMETALRRMLEETMLRRRVDETGEA